MSHLIEELGIEEVRRRGVVTHSSGRSSSAPQSSNPHSIISNRVLSVTSNRQKRVDFNTNHTIGNHAQALALAASEFGVPSHIVMPTISTPSKIAGTQTYSSHVVFSGSTSQEREAKVQEVIEQTGAIFVPPYDHPDIMLGQGTAALELHKQYMDLRRSAAAAAEENGSGEAELDAILTPLGGGGLLSGTAIYFSDKPSVKVFGAEPSFQGANDGQRGLNANPPKRIETVKSLTIGDGLRTPLGKIPWEVFTTGTEVKPKRLENIYSVTEEQIKDAMRLVLERMKVFVEPSAVVPLAVVLYDEDFRRWVYEKQKEEGGDRPWDVAIVFSGGNTTVEAIIGLFGDEKSKKGDDKQEGGEASGGKQREEGKVGMDGKAVAENVAG